jgi:hypothetical protein
MPIRRTKREGLPMTPYQEGFELGYHDVRGQWHDAGAMAEALTQAEAHGEPLFSPAHEGQYWLGYYHGRYYARTGQLPDGLLKQIREN